MKKLIAGFMALAGIFGIVACDLTPEQQANVVAAIQHREAIRNDPFLVCVRAHESDTSGSYSAQNPTSSASGAYQFIDGTWRTVSVRAGHPGYSRAIHAPAWVQDAVAYHTVYSQNGKFHWNGTGC